MWREEVVHNRGGFRSREEHHGTGKAHGHLDQNTHAHTHIEEMNIRDSNVRKERERWNIFSMYDLTRPSEWWINRCACTSLRFLFRSISLIQVVWFSSLVWEDCSPLWMGQDEDRHPSTMNKQDEDDPLSRRDFDPTYHFEAFQTIGFL